MEEPQPLPLGSGIYWAEIVDPRGQRHEVQISDDTGTPVNWIHPWLVNHRTLPWDRLDESSCFETFNGQHLKITRSVTLTWVGRNDQRYVSIFHIAPKTSTIGLVLGDKFVTQNGRASNICRDKPKIQGAKIFMQLPVSVRNPAFHLFGPKY